MGGNLKLVKWFVTNRACPLTTTTQSSAISNDGLPASSLVQQPLKTSKGRSPVQLALPHLDILHYLVQDLKFSLLQDDLDPKVILGHLTFVLQRAPPTLVSNETNDSESSQAAMVNYERQRIEQRKQKEAEMRKTYKLTQLSSTRTFSSGSRRQSQHSDREDIGFEV